MKVTKNLSLAQAIAVMANGNIGAAMAFTHVIREVSKTKSPRETAMVVISLIEMLDGKEVYGHNIWFLYKDVAKEDFEGFLKAILYVDSGNVDLTDIEQAQLTWYHSETNPHKEKFSKEAVEEGCKKHALSILFKSVLSYN
jgi:hypothetical protein